MRRWWPAFRLSLALTWVSAMLWRHLKCPALRIVSIWGPRSAGPCGQWLNDIKYLRGHLKLCEFRCFSVLRDATCLLVDADAIAVHFIKEAQELLSDGELRVSVFGRPELRKSKKWKTLLNNTRGIEFCPVQPVGGTLDPTDQKIKQRVDCLASHPAVSRIAVLTNDRDFMDCVQAVKGHGKQMVVCMDKAHASNRFFFEAAGARVLLLGEVCDGKVQAVLQADGSGRTAFTKSTWAVADPTPLLDPLLRLGYMDRADWPVLPAVAKFWFQNNIGDLVVFPASAALKEASQVLTSDVETKFAHYKHDLAFVLPMVGGTVRTPSIRERYGSDNARKIMQGGGPFMLRSSPWLTVEALRRLGFLDDSMNADMREAMLVFINVTRNKRNLRKADVLPNINDSLEMIQGKICQALLSGQIEGTWSMPPSDKNVRRFLKVEHVAPQAVFNTMKRYSKRTGLPPMTTYNGYVWQVHWSMDPENPSRRDILRPHCLQI